MPFMAKRLGLHRLTEVLQIATTEWRMRWTELAIFRRHVIADLMTFNENVLWSVKYLFTIDSSLTCLKQGEGFLNCSSIAQRTVAWQMLASYSLEFCWPAGVPLDLSYPGSLKYGSWTRMSDWIDTRTWVGKTLRLRTLTKHNWLKRTSTFGEQKVKTLDAGEKKT